MPIEPSGGAGDGLAWAQQLPAGPSAGREEAIFKAIERGDANIDWAELPVEGVVNGTVRRGKVYVFARTLRIGAQNPVRVSVNYETAQRICDLLGCAMMTPHVADLTFDQSTLKLAPQPMSKWVEDGSMAKTNRMIEYSQKLDKLVPIETPQLVSNESKHWVNTKRFWVDPDAAKRWPPSKRSANYGWWSKAAPNGRLWQSTGLAHDWFHVDYSQQLVLMHQQPDLPQMVIDLAINRQHALADQPRRHRIVITAVIFDWRIHAQPVVHPGDIVVRAVARRNMHKNQSQ
jgi:hypothetical protein